MLTAVKGYYDGTQIVVEEKERNQMIRGQELMITFSVPMDTLEASAVNGSAYSDESLAERRRKLLDSKKYVKSSGKTVEEIDRFIQELRENDRV